VSGKATAPALGFSPRLPGASNRVTLNASRGSVFVVDDDQMQTRMMDFSLKQAGYDVVVFDSLEKLDNALTVNSPDAILMDLMFPEGELAGAEFIRSHRNSIDDNLPIFFLSSRRDMDARLAATRAGATRYFAKPVDMRSVISAIEKSKRRTNEILGQILIVDDDLPTAQFIGAKLKEAGIHSDYLADPLMTLDAIECINPDLIMVDYYMPGCDGLELGAIIRQHEIYYDMPIIFLTSEALVGVELAALNLGSDAFFNKALEIEVLVKSVQARLKRIKSYAHIKRAPSDIDS
jgi:DNA-binding response OmpR family regulator